jgi:DNA (cytosine-5)-methyltransferase 3A
MYTKGINVLSLFDGIGGGRIALDRIGAKIDHYYASEVDSNAIKICQKNWDDVIEIGDVRLIDGNQYKGQLDLLCGGSPCQNFSFAGTMKGAVTTSNIEITTLEQYLELKNKGFEFEGQSYLFWEYVRILKETKPKYFLLENVKMAKKWENIITRALGV